jgi:hypothetical protein
VKRVAALIAVGLGGTLAALALLEGAASLLITVGLFFGPSSRFAQERYARYDPDLGWVALPNVAIPDMFGTGVALHTNAQGFRGRDDTRLEPAPGRVRVMCSGDSFTFGFGVADDETWCALLPTLDRRLDSVNLGQGGYGVDQAFLRYRRDGARFAPALHLFAFIDGDFERMRSNRFLDFGKPTLALRNGALVVENVPAPRTPFFVPSARTIEIVRRTKTFELYDRLVQRLAGAPPIPAEAGLTPRPEIVDVSLALFDELRALATSTHGRLVLVHLPIAADCRNASAGFAWWTTLLPRLRERGFELVDLGENCRGLASTDLDPLFIREEDSRYFGGAGHYTVAGNRFFANALYAKLHPLIDAVSAAP